jgi:predicted Zn-dependent peptidase
MLREIRRMSEEPVPEEELARARNYVALRLPQGFETVSDLATRVSELVLYGLDLDYYRGYVDGILAVSAGDVQDAARRYLSGGLAVVVVGDRTAVEEPLRALGVGPVVTVDLEEEAGSQDPL